MEIEMITDTTKMKLTPSQEKRLERYAHDILEYDGLGRYKNDYEYKIFEVSQDIDGRCLFLLTEVGRKGDEGTAASVLCRTRRHIMIGKGGACLLLNPKTFKPRSRNGAIRGYHNTLITIPD